MAEPVRQRLLDRKATLIAYLRAKTDQGDWHAVQDAASDIRELDAQLQLLREVIDPAVDLQGEAGPF